MKTLHSQQLTNRATARFIYEVGNKGIDPIQYAQSEMKREYGYTKIYKTAAYYKALIQNAEDLELTADEVLFCTQIKEQYVTRANEAEALSRGKLSVKNHNEAVREINRLEAMSAFTSINKKVDTYLNNIQQQTKGDINDIIS